MEIPKNYSNLISLLYILKKIEGRKKFQKIVYILKQMSLDFDEGFTFHFYGPYSSELQFEIDELVEKEYFKEEKDENNTYVYKINFDDVKDTKSDLIKAKDIIEELNGKRAQFLEMLSTIIYLLKMGYEEKDALKQAAILKPSLTDYIDDAFKYYKERLSVHMN